MPTQQPAFIPPILHNPPPHTPTNPSRTPARSPLPSTCIPRRLFLLTTLATTTLNLFSPAPTHADSPLPQTPDEWREKLTLPAYRVLREGGTERAFTSPLNTEYRRGTFYCAGCGNPLFSSTAKFDSGTGWPSFFQPLEGAVVTRQSPKDKFFMKKQVKCQVCGGHLGHVFADGPRPTGSRYCMNGVAMYFRPQ